MTGPVDRTEKHKIERLAKMVPLRSPECKQGTHASCNGLVLIQIGGEVMRRPSERGLTIWPDSIERRCGCHCHNDFAQPHPIRKEQS